MDPADEPQDDGGEGGGMKQGKRKGEEGRFPAETQRRRDAEAQRGGDVGWILRCAQNDKVPF